MMCCGTDRDGSMYRQECDGVNVRAGSYPTVLEDHRRQVQQSLPATPHAISPSQGQGGVRRDEKERGRDVMAACQKEAHPILSLLPILSWSKTSTRSRMSWLSGRILNAKVWSNCGFSVFGRTSVLRWSGVSVRISSSRVSTTNGSLDLLLRQPSTRFKLESAGLGVRSGLVRGHCELTICLPTSALCSCSP